jgi:Ala-tRNA(Pro) deacylase
MNELELYNFLEEHSIDYLHLEHPAVYTVAQANEHLFDAPGARTKNLFICDEKKQNYFILWVHSDKKIHFNRLGKQEKLGKPRFGSPEKLLEYLGLTPGAVSVLALVNDKQHHVSILIDNELWKFDSFQCHPLVNTATCVISREDIQSFFDLTGHDYKFIDVPAKE